jgi:hypothetical protein
MTGLDDGCPVIGVGVDKTWAPLSGPPILDPFLDPILDPNLDPILNLLKTNRPGCRTQLFGFQYHDDRLNSFSFL